LKLISVYLWTQRPITGTVTGIDGVCASR